jgi:hypothetical protein
MQKSQDSEHLESKRSPRPTCTDHVQVTEGRLHDPNSAKHTEDLVRGGYPKQKEQQQYNLTDVRYAAFGAHQGCLLA